jgi:signal transduction histidine kinase
VPELTPQAERLRELIRFNEWAAPVGVPAVLVMWWFYRTPSLLIIAGLVALTIVDQRYAIRYTLANRVETGILALSVAIWTPTIGMAVLAPQVWAITVVFSVLAVLLALLYVGSGRLLGLIGVSCVILGIGGYFHTSPLWHAFPPDTSPAVLGAIIACGSGVGAVLCMFSVWQSNTRVLETVAGLRESERTLEQRVEERTVDLVESQRELSLARDEALAANQAKSTFLANMSHELRTPLNAIIGYSEMLQEDAEDEGRGEAAGDLGKIMGSLVTRRGNQLDVDCAADTGSMHSDLTKVRQILLNLLSNAAKFTENGNIGLHAERRVEAGREWIQLRVRDTGIGMTSKQLASVFDAFTQAEKTTQRDYGGTGLGLAICRRFCLMLSGELTVTSEPGAGSEFRVLLPKDLPEASP